MHQLCGAVNYFDICSSKRWVFAVSVVSFNIHKVELILLGSQGTI